MKIKTWLVILAAVLMSACAAFNPLEKPQVAITHIKMAPANGLQQRLLVGLQLDNPNSFALNLGRLRYQLSLQGQALAGGSLNESFSLPANGRTEIVVPVEVNLLSGLGVLRAIMGSMQSDLDYQLSLTTAVENFGLGDITINKKGKVGLGSTAP
ncbi:MAG: LEA type 2 family protein [Zhongshania sp.]|uniref:LEA type 2 family protein n=1 Tax=Zhongshania sp. TaxID=1971902 RepID=UPI002610FA85|nr:LEA type 2 family protein [Zhongshania sp.]MDF1692790.1 LEA type 2 family protein [Zhongshania sp.]